MSTPTYQAPRYLLCVRLSGEYAHRRCRATYYEHAYQVRCPSTHYEYADQVPLYSLLNLPGAALLAISTRARCRSLLPMSTRTRCRATHYEHAYQVPRYL